MDNSFFASSPGLPWQHGRRQLGWYITATLRKQFPNLTKQFILSLGRLRFLLSCSVLDLEVGLHGVVEGAHEGGVVHRGGLPREAALVALVAVCQDVLALQRNHP